MNSKKRTTIRVVGLSLGVAILMVITACGQKGALYLPKPATPEVNHSEATNQKIPLDTAILLKNIQADPNDF